MTVHTHIVTHNTHIYKSVKPPPIHTHLHAHTCKHTQTHIPNKFVWKVTEVSHCHYTAHACHFSVSHQYITHKTVFSHTHAASHSHTHTYCHHIRLTNAQNHFNTNRATAQPGRYKTRLCFYKTNCLWSSDEAPTAGANDYKHWSDGYKYLCSYGVILASKTVTCIFSRESDTTGINMMGFGINII